MTRAAITAERALLHDLQGGCQIPVGALALEERGQLHLRAIVASLDGSRAVEGSTSGDQAQAEAVGRQLAADLLSRGANRILDEIRERQDGGSS